MSDVIEQYLLPELLRLLFYCSRYFPRLSYNPGKKNLTIALAITTVRTSRRANNKHTQVYTPQPQLTERRSDWSIEVSNKHTQGYTPQPQLTEGRSDWSIEVSNKHTQGYTPQLQLTEERSDWSIEVSNKHTQGTHHNYS